VRRFAEGVEPHHTWLNRARSNVNMGKDIFSPSSDCAAVQR